MTDYARLLYDNGRGSVNGGGARAQAPGITQWRGVMAVWTCLAGAHAWWVSRNYFLTEMFSNMRFLWIYHLSHLSRPQHVGPKYHK